MKAFRTEKDSLGEVQVPATAWYGAQTARAVANFPISGRLPDKDFVLAHVRIKLAAAHANCQPGWLPAEKRDAIAAACEKILAGEYSDQFVVDRFQAGAGTSHNMNSNEVIANLANVALGGEKGTYKPVNPNDDVNMGQSTNDTIPTAIRLAVLAKLPRLTAAVHAMAAEFSRLAEREKDTVKSGRTHLQDAVPTTVGREFGAYAFALRRCARQLTTTRPLLAEIGLGGSAAGTGLNTAPGYAENAAHELARLTGEPIRPAADLAASMQSMHDLAALSSAIRGLAIELTRIANDLRLLCSGPRTGLGEIVLPAVQPGSSIMPGKINPVIPEAINQIAFRVFGLDLTVTFAAEAGQLQLNAFTPVIVSSVDEAVSLLIAGMDILGTGCIAGIKIDQQRCEEILDGSLASAIELVPVVGYKAANEIMKAARLSGSSIDDAHALWQSERVIAR